MPSDVSCLLSAVCCLMPPACYPLSVYYLLSTACCMLSTVCRVLLSIFLSGCGLFQALSTAVLLAMMNVREVLLIRFGNTTYDQYRRTCVVRETSPLAKNTVEADWRLLLAGLRARREAAQQGLFGQVCCAE